MTNIVYGLTFKGKSIHDVDFFTKSMDGSLRGVKIPKKFYTKEGYAKNGANNLPQFIDREYLRIVVYEQTRELDWRQSE